MTRRLILPDSGAPSGPDARRNAPSAERNVAPILEVLARLAPASGRALELASGTGQHSVAFAAAHPGLDWQPSDLDPENLPSISAWARQSPQPNLRAPLLLNAARPGWSLQLPGWSLIVAVNLLHLVTKPEATIILTETCRALAPGGRLAFYGPFLRRGLPTSDGDAAFDASLRAQDPAIGYKDVGWVLDHLRGAGLQNAETYPMPANNLFLIADHPV